MAKIATSITFGDRDNLDVNTLLDFVEKMYIDLADAVNSKPNLIERATDGQPAEAFLTNGTLNLNTATNKVEMLTNHTSGTAVTWTQLS
ncbi:MAG: hypothetical protein KAI88_06340 [Nitrosomonadaceae bacterium]|nr:hypothetical protein [Nitrosomonadaceae bacterium]